MKPQVRECKSNVPTYLDRAVVVLVLSCLVSSALTVAMIAVYPQYGNELSVELAEGEFDTYVTYPLAIITVVVLVLWCVIGRGLQSKIWRWLPPFVLFCRYGKVVRACVVGALIIGTVLGMVL